MRLSTGTKTIYLPLSDHVKNILNDYDAEKLLNTIPDNYFSEHFLPPASVLERKIKLPIDTSTPVTLSKKSCEWLKGASSNQQISLSLLFNFLIECVADCGKIHTKNISRALDCYYYAVNNDKELFSRILSEYADSVYYNDEIGLSEEGIAYFLTLSQERTSYIK